MFMLHKHSYINYVSVHKHSLCAHKPIAHKLSLYPISAKGVVAIVLGGVIIIVMIIPCRVMLEKIEGLYLIVNTAVDFPVG